MTVTSSLAPVTFTCRVFFLIIALCWMELFSREIHSGSYSATGSLIQEDIMKRICQECGSWELIIIFHYGYLIGVLVIFFIYNVFVLMHFMILQKCIQRIKKQQPTNEAQVLKFI